ncbi:CHRD domain-containing protein [Robbsia sp. Bb-Pol-6]|uniref:CHRD domain-containing protein n=1 Tax=Robbsia betulipollinis TaxID=2981849 RepID=A0ABT3ZTC5_9BURK|nr:CHRD domain-containing protein [Robbsia betulipollinis]MCY0389492.1 CHRD domain-containing protein [Robbsia betulipollinis]
MSPKILASILAVSASLAVVPLAASAKTVHFGSTLNTAQEVPPHGTEGTGTLKATYNTVSKALDYKVSYDKLTGPATAAHFHGPAAPGENAKPVVPVPADALASPIRGHAVLTAEQASDLMAGKWYFNVHTAANPGGEIRGQVEQTKK